MTDLLTSLHVGSLAALVAAVHYMYMREYWMQAISNHLGTVTKGSRLAFDLGKSDIKTVAVKDGEVLFSQATEWNVTNSDPQYHYYLILTQMKLAAGKLPKIEAVGGSATGTITDSNEAV